MALCKIYPRQTLSSQSGQTPVSQKLNSSLRNNKSMNNKYRITIQDTPVQNTSRSTCLSEIKSFLKTPTLRNEKSMNNKYKIKETHNLSEASSFEDRKIKSGLMESAFSNNTTMNNDYRTTIILFDG